MAAEYELYERIARECSVRTGQVSATASLLDEGATVPFIARYRKEATGTLDEVVITTIRDRLSELRDLEKRRSAILTSLRERGLLRPDLEIAIRGAESLAALEDLYLPYRPKRRTRASVARERGLEPLAEGLLSQDSDLDPVSQAESFVDQEKGVLNADDALAGARDIIAEEISENAEARASMRKTYRTWATLKTRVIKGKESEGGVYQDYFDWEEPVANAPSHRVLAILRAEDEGIISSVIAPERERSLSILRRRFVTGSGEASTEVEKALKDGYTRLLGPAMEREARHSLKEKADRTAIRVFAKNLRDLLLTPPLGPTRVLAIDPGFRTGCKVVCLDRQGALLHNTTIYPHPPRQDTATAARTLVELVRDYKTEAIAIGNGTAGRETYAFVRKLRIPEEVPVMMVSETGASIYSASGVARKEFPDHDITVRGAVSIGRRLMDPLAELVKIDPKSLGIGQYQHDVEQKALQQSLDDVVTSVVNQVGVDVNTASPELLSYVSGLNPRLAGAIVGYRDFHGPFDSRNELLEVPGIGPKTFEQAAGFLRIYGRNPLDASAVHPENYSVVMRMAERAGCSVEALTGSKALTDTLSPEIFVTETTGLPTVRDILAELTKPGRDPRETFEAPAFDDDINSIEDLKSGMLLPGIVTNVTAFGAFVDIGLHENGLVHISELSDHFVCHPSDVVKVNQQVRVTVISVDTARGRIALSMKAQR